MRQSLVSQRVRLLGVIGAAVCLVALVGAFIVVVFIARDLTHRLSSDEHATCAIQSRALPANKALASTLKDINELLTLRSESGSKKAITIPAADVPYLLNLKFESGRYVKIESKQPGHRDC